MSWRSLSCLFVFLSLSASAAPVADTGVIEGRVGDRDNRPLPGVSVTLLPEAGGLVHLTSTDADGRYQFAGVPADTYRVDFDLRKFDVARRNHVAARPGISTTVDAVLEISSQCECPRFRSPSSSRSLRGQVVDQMNRPLPHATLEAVGPGRRETAFADQEGRFLVRVPIDGAWSIAASDSGFESVRLQISTGNDPLVLTLLYVGAGNLPDSQRLDRGCRCSGSVFVHEGR